jgi:hypothetical protein
VCEEKRTLFESVRAPEAERARQVGGKVQTFVRLTEG